MLPEWLLALTLTLLVLDIFFETEILSWCGIVTFASYITWRIGPDWKWSILVFIIAFIISIMLHNAIQSLLLHHNTPNEMITKLQGAKGTIHYVDGTPMFRWNGDELWSIDLDIQVSEGDRVVVTSVKDGILTVSRITQ